MPFAFPSMFPWRAALIGAGSLLVVLMFMFIKGAIEQNARSKERLDAAIEMVNANADALQAERAESARLHAENLKLTKEKAALRSKFEQLRREIMNAPDSEDGPLAPVLRRVLDGLRRDEGGAAARAGAAAGAGPVAAAAVP